MFNLRSKKSSRSGFTLIELLVVISIISLLSSVVISSLNTARAKSRDTRRMIDLKAVQAALELYKNDFGLYPITTGGVYWGNCASYGSHPRSGSAGYVPNLAPTYISVLPVDPNSTAAGACYIYYSPDGVEYKFAAFNTIETKCPVPASNTFADLRYPSPANCVFSVSSSIWANTNY